MEICNINDLNERKTYYRKQYDTITIITNGYNIVLTYDDTKDNELKHLENIKKILKHSGMKNMTNELIKAAKYLSKNLDYRLTYEKKRWWI